MSVIETVASDPDAQSVLSMCDDEQAAFRRMLCHHLVIHETQTMDRPLLPYYVESAIHEVATDGLNSAVWEAMEYE